MLYDSILFDLVLIDFVVLIDYAFIDEVLIDLVLYSELRALEHLLFIWHGYNQRRAPSVSTKAAGGLPVKPVNHLQINLSWQNCAH